jgi:hypothetical protein
MAAFRRRGLHLPPPIVVADSWFSDSKLRRHVAATHQGTFLVEGKSSYVFELPTGRQVKGHDLQQDRLGLGGRVSRCLGCAMHGCGPPVRRMVL